MTEPRWMIYARSLIGVREVPGAGNNPTILGWARKLGAKILGIAYTADATPWCGLFCAHVMDQVGIEPPLIAVRASAWGDWGIKLSAPRPGCILTFVREGGGHVGFYVAEDATHYHVLGGNQGDVVSITRIPKGRLAQMRWPAETPLPPPKIVRVKPNGVPLTAGEQ